MMIKLSVYVPLNILLLSLFLLLLLAYFSYTLTYKNKIMGI